MPRKPRTQDRHNIPAPSMDLVQLKPEGALIVADLAFLDGFKERIKDLFLTLPGLPGHVTQVQQEFNRLNNSRLPGDRKKLVGDEAFDRICKAAAFAAMDFPEQTFTIASIGRTYKVRRERGKVMRETYRE